MRDFVYNMPVLITPKWVDSLANPIALANLNTYLQKFAKEQPKMHQTFELGGPDVPSYREQFQILCELTGNPIAYGRRAFSLQAWLHAGSVW